MLKCSKHPRLQIVQKLPWSLKKELKYYVGDPEDLQRKDTNNERLTEQ